jgi:hypothetical protein
MKSEPVKFKIKTSKFVRIRFFFTAAYITIEFPIHPIKSTKITSTVHTANEAV